MEIIKSKDNKKIKYLNRLQQRKFRDKEGKYIAEGLRTISDMITTANIEYVLIEEEYLDNDNYTSLLDELYEQDIPCYVLDEYMDHNIKLTESSQGIWAVIIKDEITFEEYIKENNIDKDSDDIYLLLDQIQDPGNLGTIIRTAIAANVKTIFLTKGSVDPYNPKTVRSSMSALGKINIITMLEDNEVQYLLEHKNLENYVLSPHAQKSYTDFSYEGNVLLILGNEGNGVRSEIIEKAKNLIIIPMYGDIESLNLSIAGGLTMYKVREKKTLVEKNPVL